jgi:hypothetical protein
VVVLRLLCFTCLVFNETEGEAAPALAEDITLDDRSAELTSPAEAPNCPSNMCHSASLHLTDLQDVFGFTAPFFLARQTSSSLFIMSDPTIMFSVWLVLCVLTTGVAPLVEPGSHLQIVSAARFRNAPLKTMWPRSL